MCWINEESTNMFKRRSICFVSGSYHKQNMGGAELQSYYLSKEFVNNKWEVHFTCTYLGHKNKKLIIDEGIKIHKFKYYRRLFDITSFYNIYKLLKNINADIYYFRGTYYAGITGYYAKVHKKIFILAISSDINCDKNIFTKKLLKSNIKLFKKIILYLDAKIKDFTYLYGLNNANQVLVQNKYQKDSLRKKLNVKSMLLKNGHPVEFRLPPKTNPPIVLWLGSLKRLRQAELFIKLATHCEDLNCRFIMAGRALSEDYRDEIIKQLQGSSNVKYIGSISLDESNELMGKASIFVNTSTHEGFPNTFIQAWMRETPIVSLNVDPDYIIKNLQLGFHSRTFDQLVDRKSVV